MNKLSNDLKRFAVGVSIVSLLLISCKHNGSGKYKKLILADTTHGKVIAIIDGDTFDVLLTSNRKMRVRMSDIDAPERGMPYYKVSKDYLSSLCFQKEVRLVYIDTDQHNRSINRSFSIDGTDLSKEMIRHGLAWHYKQFSSDNELSDLERKARDERTGLWADRHPAEPWLVRKIRRQHNHIEFTADSMIITSTR